MQKLSRKLLLAGVLGFLAVYGCGCQLQPAPSHTIAVIGKNSSTEFWKSVENGAADAAAEKGIHMEYLAPAKENSEEQLRLLESALENGAEAVAVAPIDAEKTKALLSRYEEVKWITLDSDAALSEYSPCIGASVSSACETAAAYAAGILRRTSGQAAIVKSCGEETENECQNAFTAALEAEKLSISSVVRTGGNVQQTKEAVKELLMENPELRFVFAVDETGTIGTCRAVEELGKKGKIHVIGCESSQNAVQFINSGILDGVILKNAYLMGYLSVREADKLLEGYAVPENTEIGMVYAEAENLNQPEIQLYFGQRSE